MGFGPPCGTCNSQVKRKWLWVFLPLFPTSGSYRILYVAPGRYLSRRIHGGPPTATIPDDAVEKKRLAPKSTPPPQQNSGCAWLVLIVLVLVIIGMVAGNQLKPNELTVGERPWP